MMELPEEYTWVYEQFSRHGFHTIRRSNKFCRGLWSDLIIEQVSAEIAEEPRWNKMGTWHHRICQLCGSIQCIVAPVSVIRQHLHQHLTSNYLNGTNFCAFAQKKFKMREN